MSRDRLTLRIAKIVDPRLPQFAGHQVLTSLEGENPGGSIKDWMVLGELSEMTARGLLKKGDTVAEITAGSTGLSLAYYCRSFGLKCVLFVPKSLDPHLEAKLRGLGAELQLVNPQGAYEKYDQFSQGSALWRFDQFGKLSLRRHYHAFAEMIQVFSPLTALIGSVGTGHSLLGISDALGAFVKTVSSEPAKPSMVSGVRNLRLESFGEKDPCDSSRLQRIELDLPDFFGDSRLQTDQGLIQVSDSFRLVLGATCRFLGKCDGPQKVFAIGAQNRRAPS